jgi:sugar phosphate isomerase/epimerase
MTDSYEFFYPGTPYSLEPGYGSLFTGYRIPAANLGAPTKPDSAAQIVEVSNLLNQGIKQIEVGVMSAEVFDQIPKQHFKEINRLTKLTGSQTSVHSPMIEPSGFSREGWSEDNRIASERQLKDVIEKAHDLSPDGNIPVTVHASGIPGTEYKPIEEKGEIKNVAYRMIAVNQETGQMVPIMREEKYYPEEGKVIRTPEQELKAINNTDWINNLTNLAFYKKEADETIIPAASKLAGLFAKKEEDWTKEEIEKNKGAFEQLNRAELFLENIEGSFRTIYNKAYKFGNEEIRKELNKISKEWVENSEEMKKMKNPYEAIIMKSNLINSTLNKVRNIHTPPELYKPIEKFAIQKASETFANTALHAYKKFGEKSPIVSIENLYPGMAFSRSEDLKNLVNEAREKFIINAVKEGIGRSEAQEAAKKLIGATWDVGHLNIMRKEGFKEKDIIEESKRIAPYVKHIHLTDNFGYSDSHLPPGMGNVPFKEIMKEMEKAGFKGKGIVEAGGFVQHFKTSPHPYVLEAFGSPVYAMVAAPYWNQAMGTFGNYMGGPIAYMPEQHFSMYGSGFSSLPADLGGQMPGKQSRLSGTPTD